VVGFYALAGQSGLIRAAALVGGLLLAVVFAWTSQMGRDFVGFARESVRETKKVVWPSRKEATQITGVVFGFVVVMAIFLWGTDKLLEVVLYSLILGWR
jgi:preprotein translocase subunit SecE